ncbi:hypothetical protein [Providencia alcalifaciens]|jgi:hypothetical protein|uniref:hypothetical protein n=1 Tax=Providencia alcalifaciens TaxID=126385 RepID=UPI001CC532BE|nr:hypothetical protein PO864_20465 [Providencia alcalifaciens]CAG9437394.1 hypothetical protein NVI2019_KOLGMIGM_04207 [Providencia alcalifaciens]CAG9437410.1 hypothetical protein NVI2019_ANGEOOBF_04206 [Providencia alcalifaciens]CAG9437442.1 hypothetical protein NVI2019_PLFLNFOB_04204 [Providencia alcalifaciens]CAG9437443.1 hypothetical protein NVI2019_OGMBKCAO_04207 [Providencia alcalifaciens]
MKIDEISTLVDKCGIFDGKNLSYKQKEIAIRYVFGQTAEELARHFNNSARSIWLHLDVVRNEFGNVSLSSLRTIIFMKLICQLINIKI